MPFGLTKRAKNHQNWHRGVTMLYHPAQPSRALRHALSLLQLSMLSLETPRCLLHPKSLLQLFGISWSLSKPWTKNLSTLWYLLSFLWLYSLLCLTLRAPQASPLKQHPMIRSAKDRNSLYGQVFWQSWLFLQNKQTTAWWHLPTSLLRETTNVIFPITRVLVSRATVTPFPNPVLTVSELQPPLSTNFWTFKMNMRSDEMSEEVILWSVFLSNRH